jgi:hypothetical protein
VVPVVTLVTLGAVESSAQRAWVFRIQQTLIIQQVDRTGYRLQGAEAYLAHPGDRLDRVGAGIQTRHGTIVLQLDTQAGTITLPPHSRLRIVRLTPHPAGGQWVNLTIEQGTAATALWPWSQCWPMAPESAQSLDGVRALGWTLGWRA